MRCYSDFLGLGHIWGIHIWGFLRVGPYMGKGHIRGGDGRMGHARGVRPSRGKGATGHIMVGTTRGHKVI